MREKFLVDTDVLIDYLRGQAQAVAYLETLDEPFHVSVVSVAELFAGVRDGEERDRLASFLGACNIVELNAAISESGGLYRRDYGKSHGVGLADALIAATADSQEMTVVTLNAKHYPGLKNVHTPYRKS